MTKIAPSTAVNRYYLARMAAAEKNERLSSREGASEETGIDRKRMQRIEIGTLNPYPEEVLLMADAYHAPELMNYHCSQCCPIGQRTVPRAEVSELDRITVKFLNALEQIRDSDKELLRIAQDGTLTVDEVPQMEHLLIGIQRIATVALEIQIYLDKRR
jgi:toxin-antitoxin system, antitoxin component, xre family